MTYNFIRTNMEGRISTTLGLVTGFILNITGTQLLMAVGIAFMTGAASYLGTLSVKFLITWGKKKFTVKITPKKS